MGIGVRWLLGRVKLGRGGRNEGQRRFESSKLIMCTFTVSLQSVFNDSEYSTVISELYHCYRATAHSTYRCILQ
jgi:hypothetical protein